jgi:hypothetical protein
MEERTQNAIWNYDEINKNKDIIYQNCDTEKGQFPEVNL